MSSIEKWRAFRHASVIGPQGDLGLTGMFEVKSMMSLSQIPGIWSPTSSDTPGLTVTANAEDRLTINGEPIIGTAELIADETVVEIAASVTAMATSQPGSLHLLAVWNQYDEKVTKFNGIDVYPFDESWVIQGTFIKDQANQTFSFSHTSDSEHHTRLHESPGEIMFMYEGQAYNVRPFKSEDNYIIVFRDATCDHETYSMGRMLLVQPEDNGQILLDFNRAFLPPCAFSPYFNCPMPPMCNRLPFEVTSGEKNIL